MPDSDQRHGQRAPVRLRVDYERMNSFFADYTKNISKGGTFIKTARPLPVGSRCQFSFALPALSDPLILEGEVAWVLTAGEAQQRGAEAGMGIRFVFQDPAAERELAALVERMMTASLGEEVTRGLLGR
ncbi:MAG TPA: TIGR02266 family protein [Myxococcales bacterium]|nr:TIGR02266 family protein [Myxococcales bacterium]HET9754724.1 TIGR02266 family protein [Myxococcales bacterium]